MNEVQVNAMVSELHHTINTQLQRLINMASDIATLKQMVEEKDKEIAKLSVKEEC